MSQATELLALNEIVLDNTVERISLLLEINFELGHPHTTLSDALVDTMYESCCTDAGAKGLWIIIKNSQFNLYAKIWEKLSKHYLVMLDYNGTMFCSRMNAK